MRVHNISGISLCLALVASVAAAQKPAPKPASDQRITISKGEVSLPPRDTVYLTRVDTLIVVRHDTVRVPRFYTRTTVDTIVKVVPVTAPVVRGPIYAGLFAGVTTPTGNIDRLYSTGVHAGGLLGWEPRSALGLRLRADIAQLDRERGMGTALIGAKSPLMLGLGGDAKVTLPGTGSWAPYAVGGAGLSYFRGLALASEGSGALCGADGRGGCYAPARDTRWRTEFTYAFGGGLDFHMGRQGLFLEARAQVIQADQARTWFVPISLGARLF